MAHRVPASCGRLRLPDVKLPMILQIACSRNSKRQNLHYLHVSATGYALLSNTGCASILTSTQETTVQHTCAWLSDLGNIMHAFCHLLQNAARPDCLCAGLKLLQATTWVQCMLVQVQRLALGLLGSLHGLNGHLLHANVLIQLHSACVLSESASARVARYQQPWHGLLYKELSVMPPIFLMDYGAPCRWGLEPFNCQDASMACTSPSTTLQGEQSHALAAFRGY